MTGRPDDADLDALADSLDVERERITAMAATIAALRDDMRKAVASGIREAVADPAVWASALAAVQTHAQTEAGGWLLGGLKSIVSKVAWFAVIGTGVYLLGGWSALVSLVKGVAHT